MRRVPIAEQLKVLLKGKTTIMGVVLLLLCLCFSLFTLDSNELKAVHFIGDNTPIMAKITAVIPQSTTIRVLYQYTVNNETYSGNFYTTENTYQTGNYVEVEYSDKKPKYSRLLNQGTGVGLMSMSIFLIISLLLISLELKKNVQLWLLINWGKLTRANLASKEATKKEQYIFVFHYKDQEGTLRELTEKTKEPYQYNNHETILYFPKRPAIAILVANVPPEIVLYEI